MRARSLGFRTQKINRLRHTEDLVVEVPEPFMKDNDDEIIKRRSGTEYTMYDSHESNAARPAEPLPG